METESKEDGEVKYVPSLPGGSQGSAAGSDTPGGFGPGKYVRRLNAVEAELRDCKLKCTAMEKRLTEFEDWKGKLDTWLIDSFGVAINSGIAKAIVDFNGDDGDGFDSDQGVNGSLAHQFPVTPILLPKAENEEDTRVRTEKPSNPGDGLQGRGKKLENKMGVVVEKSKRKNFSLQNGGIIVPPTTVTPTRPVTAAASSSHQLKDKKTSVRPESVPLSNEKRGETTFFIGSSVTLEITKTPAIELKRCDATGSESPQASNTTSDRIALNCPKPVILTENGEGDNNGAGNNEEISIVFSSPSRLPSANDPKNDVTHSDSNVSLTALIPEVELVEGAKRSSGPQNLQQQRRDLFHLETDDPTPCAVCGVVDPEPQNEMIFCDLCGLCVHQGCYGVGQIPFGGWKCSPCAAGANPREIQCYFCPEFGGALKPVKSPGRCHWAHMSCSMWIPEVKPENDYTLEPICGVSKIPKDRWKLKCSLCKVPRGACIQCQYSTRCTTAFHVTCAMKHGLEMKEVVPLDGSSDFILQAYCKTHTYKTKRKTGPKKKKETRSASATNGVVDTADSPSKKKRHVSTTPGERESPRNKKQKSDHPVERISPSRRENDKRAPSTSVERDLRDEETEKSAN